MKYFILSLVAIFSVNSSFSQKPDESNYSIINCEPLIGDYFWMGKTEVTNIQYLEFLNFVRSTETKDEFKKLLPDTLVWRTKLGFQEKYNEYYFRHPAYREYPVVGINKFQATAYCNWLTKILNENFKNNPKHPVAEVRVRLPLEKEWKLASQAGDENAIFAWEGSSPRRVDKKFEGQIRGNYVRMREDYMGVAGNLNDNADVTAPAKSYWPNNYGFYNLSGNVSELLYDSEYAIGGSWKTILPYLEINADTSFRELAKSSSSIGFRYAVEIVSLKPVETKTKELSAKDIEKHLVPINGELLMSKFEVSNKLYLTYLNETKTKVNVHQNNYWNAVSVYGAHMANNYATHALYENYPVVNVSQSEANLFCDWLTKKYASFSKKKYDGLEFKLPTAEQWELAAKGDNSYTTYSWGTFLRNPRGQLLCNFHPVEERLEYKVAQDTTSSFLDLTSSDLYDQRGMDGYFFTSPIDSYNPNSFGLYNMTGNVSELTSDRKCKGGSWLSYYNELKISQEEKYVGPLSTVGFRFVATVKTDSE